MTPISLICFEQQGKGQEKNLSQDSLEMKVRKENFPIKCEIWNQFSKMLLQSTLRDEKCILGQIFLLGMLYHKAVMILRNIRLYQVELIEYSIRFTHKKQDRKCDILCWTRSPFLLHLVQAIVMLLDQKLRERKKRATSMEWQ